MGSAHILLGTFYWLRANTYWAVWKFPQKLNIELPCDLVIPLLGTYPKESEAGTGAVTLTVVFTAASFALARGQRQPKCPMTDE